MEKAQKAEEELKAPSHVSQMNQLIDAAREEQFYNRLDEADHLVDYFCVVGLDQQKLQQLTTMGMSKQELH